MTKIRRQCSLWSRGPIVQRAVGSDRIVLFSPSFELTLISTGRGFRCSGIIGRTASDFQMGENAANVERRCGIQFQQLTAAQAVEIEDFIDSCTVDVNKLK